MSTLNKRVVLTLLIAAFTAAIAVACETTRNGDGATVSEVGTTPPFGNETDVSHARSMWNDELAGYENWDPYPGFSGWQPGRSPHGKVLRYYINDTAAKNPDNPGDGAIIVKENYTSESEDALVAVTVMKKIKGYDPDNADWFWVKYDSNGNVMTNPKDMKLAGRVAKGMPQGCISCHANARGGDYLFVND